MLLGDQGSIGVLIMTNGSAEDKNIPDGPPHVAGELSAPSGSSSLLNMTKVVESRGR